MQIVDSLSIGIQGYNQATERVSQAAQEIASTSITDASRQSIDQRGLTESLVDLKVAELDAKANAKVIATASDLLGTILDVTA
jgi:hypothetical protein